jgi:glutaminase
MKNGYDPQVLKQALNSVKKKSYRRGLKTGSLIGLGTLATGYLIKKKMDKKYTPVNESVSTKQKLFDRKVMRYIDCLNESEYILKEMKNLYFTKQRDIALFEENSNAALYYENQIV